MKDFIGNSLLTISVAAFMIAIAAVFCGCATTPKMKTKCYEHHNDNYSTIQCRKVRS